MPWKKARKLIKEDPRYKSYEDSDRVCVLSVSKFYWQILLCDASNQAMP